MAWQEIRTFLVLGAVGVGAGLAWHLGRSSPAFAQPLAASPVSAAGSAPEEFAPVQTFLKAHCLECHNATKQKGDISLHTYHDEASVLKDRKVWEDVLEKVQAGEMPPKKKPRPSLADSEAFVHAVQRMFDRHDRSVPIDPGRVTVRRLNRTEYNNTIRDLLGVDANPAEDFPSDDVGHGFDNIGDVLSLSPVLMERYLTAAESVTQLAFPHAPSKPVTHRVSGRFFEPAIHAHDLPEKQHRPLRLGKPLFTRYTAEDDGPYHLRVRVYPDQVTKDHKETFVVELAADDMPIKSFDVTKGTRRSPTVLDADAQLKEGEHRLIVTLLKVPGADAETNDAADKPAEKNGAGEKKADDHRNEPARELKLIGIEIQGPPDTRTHSEKMLLKADAALSKHEQARQILGRFAGRAYRRPTTPEEVERLVALAEGYDAGADVPAERKWEAGIQFAMQAVLVSPKFLFRLELDDRPDSPGPHPLDEFQLASRLSYFLWSTMPDQELFDLAGRKQLTPNLDAQVRRMLQDPKASALVDNFAMQWLQLRRLKNFSPDEEMFPDFNERLRSAMLKQTSLFFESIVKEDRSILDLIDSDYTFLNEPLSRHYSIADTNGNPFDAKAIAPVGKRIRGPEFVRVHLADRTRGGVLTQASVLAVTSNPTRTSPVKRGKFVLEQILGAPPPPPPPNVPQLKSDEKAVSAASLRVRMEEHRANPACANCHEQMDGIGFAFENFDAVGAWRTKDGAFDIDASGTTPDGSSFNGVAQLKSMLMAKKKLFARCLTKKMMTYAIGRGTEFYDQRAVEKIVSALDQNDYKFSTLVRQIVQSDPFRQRRGKEQSP